MRQGRFDFGVVIEFFCRSEVIANVLSKSFSCLSKEPISDAVFLVDPFSPVSLQDVRVGVGLLRYDLVCRTGGKVDPTAIIARDRDSDRFIASQQVAPKIVLNEVCL